MTFHILSPSLDISGLRRGLRGARKSPWAFSLGWVTGLACALSLAAPALPQEDEPPPAEPREAAAEAAAEAGDDAESDAVASFFAVTTVTATGREADTFDIPTPVSVIPAEAIERKLPENAADLLRELPGVDVNGVGPNQARPIIRGQRGLRVLFLENGLRLNNARRQTDFGEITGLVSMDAVETVEVVRGPASVLYGSDAIGGVLNLITRRPGGRRGVGGGLDLRYASASEEIRGHAEVDGRFDKLSFRLGFATRDADAYEAAAGSFGDITLDDATPVLDTGVDDDSWNCYLGYAPSDRHEVFLRFNRYRAGETGFGLVDPVLLGEGDDFRIRILYPFQDFDRLTFGYFGSALTTPAADSVDLQLYWQSNERQLVNDIDINIGPIFPGAPDSAVTIDTLNFTDLDTVGGRAELIKVFGRRHVVTYGGELYRDDSFNTDHSVTTTTIRFPFPPFEAVDVETDDMANAPNAENTSYGVFVQDEIAVSQRLQLIVGARYQNVETRAEPTPGWDIAGLDFSDDEVVGAVNFLYRINDELRLVGSWAQAFRAPNIIERLFNGPTPEGSGYQILNPELTSEKSDSFDVGFKYRRRNAFFEALYFENDIDDGIIQDFLSDEEIAELPEDVQREIDDLGLEVVVQQRNLDRLRYEGVEVTLGYHSRAGLSVGGNYTHLKAERIGVAAAAVENLVSDKYNVFARWEPRSGRYWLEYRVRRNGDEPAQLDPDDPVPPVGEVLPAFTIHTLSGGVTIFERDRQRHRLQVVIDNLTDELYAEFSNASFFRPQPKRNVIASYQLRF